MKDSIFKLILSLTAVSICAIIALTTICLASLGFNSQISASKEKIEVATENTNSNLTN